MNRLTYSIAACLTIVSRALAGPPSDTTFTYQGELADGGAPASGAYNIDFALWDAVAGGNPIGAPLMFNSLPISDGLFTVDLDFGASAFDNSARWLEVTVNGAELSPRTPITRAPYAIQTRGLFVNDAGWVGMGMIAPQVPLHIAQNTGEGLPPITAGTMLLAQQNNSDNWAHMTILAGRFGRAQLNFGDADHDSQGAVTYNNITDTMTLRVDAAPRVTINSLGDVGIGTTTPANLLHLSGENYKLLMESTGHVDLALGRASPSHYCNLQFTDGDPTIGANSRWAIGLRGVGATSNLHFFDEVNNRFVLTMTQDGNVGINVFDPSFQLELSQDSATKPTSNTWTIASDERLKKNVHTIDGALDNLLRLRGVTYQWIDPESQGDMHGTYTGMIAQDVERVFPEWVSEAADGYKRLTVIGFEGLVVEALRELNTENKRHARRDAEVIALRAENESLRTRLEALERTVAQFISPQGEAQ